MAAEAGIAYVTIAASAKDLVKDLRRELTAAEGPASEAGASVGRRFSSSFGKAALAGVATSVVLVTAGIRKLVRGGLREFTVFEKGMGEVFTLLPGISQQAMGEMTDQVKQFSREFGVLPEQAIPALYQAISAGVPQQNVFSFLQTAQKAARGGVTSLETAVDGISSVMNAYGKEVMTASQASDLMFTAVRLGKTTFEELASSLFNVVPTAAALKVKFGDVTAALAVMTAQGVPTSVATTQLRQLFVELSKSTSNTAKTFEKVAGKSFPEFMASGGNVQEALQLLRGYAEKAGVPISDLFSSVEAGNAALALSGPNAEAFADALGEMANAAGATDAAYERMAETISAKVDKLKAKFKTLLVNVGDKLAPVFEKVIEALDRAMPTIEKVAVAVGEKLGRALTWLLENLPNLGGGFRAFMTVINPVGSFLLELARNLWPMLQGVMQRFIDWLRSPQGMTVMQSLFDTLGRVAQAVGSILAKIWPVVQGVIEAFINWLGSPAGAALIQTLLDAVGTAARILQQVFEAVWPLIQQAVQIFIDFFNSPTGQQLIKTLLEAIGTVLKTLQGVFEAVWPAIQKAVQIFIDFFNSPTGQKLIKTLTEAIGTALEAVQAIWEKAWPLIQGALERAKPIIMAALKAIEGAVWLIAKALEIVLTLFDRLANVKRSLSLDYRNPRGTLEGGGTYQAHAAGGLVTRPTLSLVGEAGPELILPLTRPARTRQLLAEAGLSAGMTVNVYGPLIDGSRMSTADVDGLIAAIQGATRMRSI